MSQIFISYANEDTGFARRLAGAFEGQGWSVWWDKQIPPGMDYAHVIEAAVTEAKCIVVLWSKNSIASRWVQTEAAAGADRNIVATVIVDETPGDRIPFEFRRLQAVNLKDWQPGVPHAGFDLLANRVRSMLDEPQQPPKPIKQDAELASWKDALTNWGSGRQRAYRIGGAITGVMGVVSCSEAMDMGDTDTLLGSLFFIGLSAYLLYMGRKAS